MKKVFFIDIDGTILPHGNNQKVSLKTKYAFDALRKNGHDVVIATGKSRYMVNNIFEDLKVDHYITCNGALICQSGKIIDSKEMKDIDIRTIIEFCKEHNYMVGVQQDDEYYMLDINIDYEMYPKAFSSINLDIPKVNDTIKGKVYQLWIIGDLSKFDFTKEIIAGYKQMRWHENATDIISKEISKKSAIEKYLSNNYQQQVEVYCFGDGENDIEMLEYADIGVAMDNASDVVKVHADVITDSCENDGVYEFLVKNKIIKEISHE